jgi:hypothetical protein
MEHRTNAETSEQDSGAILPRPADQAHPADQGWETRAEACLRDMWSFFNRKVIALHDAGRQDEAAEMSDLREQVQALLYERPQRISALDAADQHAHPLTQLAEGSGLPASDDPDSFMPSLP